MQIDDRMAVDVVHVEHAWWYPEAKGPEHEWRRSAANLLFGHRHFDPESGAEALRGSLGRVSRA